MSKTPANPALGPEWQHVRATYTALTDQIAHMAIGQKITAAFRKKFAAVDTALTAMRDATHTYRDAMEKVASTSGIALAVNSGIPPRCAVNDGYYGDRYSDPVWLATGWAAAWDFRNDGWVVPGLHGGPSPSDYDHLPKGAKAKTVQWLMLPLRQGTESKPGMSFAPVIAKGRREIPIPRNQRPENVPPLPAVYTKVYHEVHGNGEVCEYESPYESEVTIDFERNSPLMTGAGGKKRLVWALAWDRTHLHMVGTRLSARDAHLGTGDRIVHDIFGLGVVKNCTETRAGKPKSVIAVFDRHGEKNMLWSFCAEKIVRLDAVRDVEAVAKMTLRKKGKKP